MAHSEHNKPKKSASYALIIFGAFLFVSAPLFFGPGTTEGGIAIVLGFIAGGIGFYLGFVRKKKI
ncbi:MAG: hypothetical protein ACREAF_04830 [Nitrosopumilaceae archaeon]